MTIQTKTSLICAAMTALLMASTAGCTAVRADTAVTDTRLEIYRLFQKALDDGHEHRFDEAIAAANIIRAEYPHEPAGVLALITVYQSIMDSYKVRACETTVDSLVALTVTLAKEAIKKDKRNGINYFYLATAHGAGSISHARRGHWLEAFRNGTQIKRNFEMALRYQPEFYDTYYGLGIYNYWLAASSRVLSLLTSGKEQAIEQVRTAIAKGRFLRTTAMYGLSAIYLNEGRLQASLALCNELLQRYPNNPTLYYRSGRIYQELGEWQSAKRAFDKLSVLLAAATYQSKPYQAECLLRLARCESEIGNGETAAGLYDRAIELEKCFGPDHDADDQYEEIKKKVSQLIDD
jgi:tetratricopeptide (TPR) repeat protein